MEKNKYAIEAENVVVRYKTLKVVEGKKKQLLRIKKSNREAFEAVRGISFKIKRGDIVGVVGKNGSGKSTLLQTIAGIFSPDEGSIDLHNNTISLLSIGVGFQRKLTGRENIKLTGLLLGFTEKQIEEKIDEIIEFSELGSFIEKPVNTYSSGMYSKLAFSISVILETEIILIDEVLSVGDAKFKKKSLKKMKELIGNEDRTVLIVSHSSDTIRQLCSVVMWMHEGKIVKMGPTDEVMKEYDEFMS